MQDYRRVFSLLILSPWTFETAELYCFMNHFFFLSVTWGVSKPSCSGADHPGRTLHQALSNLLWNTASTKVP